MKDTARFKTLDGLRGVAAIAVVLLHVSYVYGIPRPRSAYLAVDLFFALSGFVLAKTYDPKFADGLTAVEFIKLRFLRLYPLFIIGLVLGLVSLSLKWLDGTISYRAILSTTPFNAVMLPAPVYGWTLFPGNSPAWSLFCEFWIANVGYAFFWRQLVGWKLIAFILASAVALITVAIMYNGLDVGYIRPKMVGGIVRVCFSFSLGVALWRGYSEKPRLKNIPSWFLCSILAVALYVPHSLRFGIIYDLTCAIVLFPMIIIAGAGAKERRAWFGVLIGEVSYAIYIVHYPMLDLVARAVPSSGRWDTLLVAVLLITMFGTAYALHHRYDRWMRQRMIHFATGFGRRDRFRV